MVELGGTSSRISITSHDCKTPQLLVLGFFFISLLKKKICSFFISLKSILQNILIFHLVTKFLVQGIFTKYKHPFAITYLGASLMVIYLPLSFLKDFIYNSMRRHSGNASASKIASKSSFGGSAPLKNGEFQKMLEMESQKTIVINCTDVSIPVVEETKPLICGITEINDGVLKDKQLSTKEIATYGLYLCPLWFVTEVILQ